ncbi:hypothetical protein TRIUR3_28061 [Triticum urartu]|uniref:Uncharacterized protein n=1 Tax=Triticum urartu TaxID=4572 RepID=M7YQ00_TRIUA|nr:hypothetical protein TRIUR3_28061 [Triticum urartu]
MARPKVGLGQEVKKTTWTQSPARRQRREGWGRARGGWMPAARRDGAARRAGGGAPGRSGRKSIPALLGRREAEARGGSRTESKN